MDAFDEKRVQIEVVPDIADAEAGIVIVTARITAYSSRQTPDIGAAILILPSFL